MAFFDGHLHSTASDGQLVPEEVVDMARAAGVRALALTDHDTFAGHARAAERARHHGIDFVPGVEMSVEFDGREIHVLAYFVSGDTAPDLARALDDARARRHAHLSTQLARLTELGYPLDEAEVLAQLPPQIAGTQPAMQPLGRPHVARALVRRGYMRSVDEVFDRLLANDKPGYVRRPLPDAAAMIALARAAGGVCSVAHPGANDVGAPALERLRAAGMLGIEVHHPDHDNADIVFYLRECQRLGCIATGGSDHHGPPAPRLTRDARGLDKDGYQRLLRVRPSVPPRAARDSALLDEQADGLNAEAEDVLSYQVKT